MSWHTVLRVQPALKKTELVMVARKTLGDRVLALPGDVLSAKYPGPALKALYDGWVVYPIPGSATIVTVHTNFGWACLPASHGIVSEGWWKHRTAGHRAAMLRTSVIDGMVVTETLGDYAEFLLGHRWFHRGVWGPLEACLDSGEVETLRFLHALGGGVPELPKVLYDPVGVAGPLR